MAPNKPKTPTVSVRIDPELWQKAVKKAADNGETVSGLIRTMLLAYVEGPPPPGTSTKGTT